MKTETIFLELEAGGDGAPPTELRVFPKGKFATKKGEFLFDEKAAATVMAEYQAHGVDKHIDYCHAGVSADARVTDKVAAAWYGLEVRDGELWATNVRWTPPGLDHVRNKQFRYLSPAFTVERESRRIVELINVALTNLPATRNQLPLVAAEADVSAKGDNHMSNTIAVALGLSPDAPESDVLARLSRDREVVGELVKLSGKDEPRAALAVARGWQQSATQLDAARTELAALQARVSKADVAAAVERGEQAGKITPGMRDYWLAKSAGEVAAFLEVAPVVVNLGKRPLPERKPAGAGRPAAEAPSEELLEQLGMTADEYTKLEAIARREGTLPEG